MICKACGRNSVNESANFCEYCGTSFREDGIVKQENSLIEGKEAFQDMNSNKNAENDKPISFGNWVGTMLLPFIPIVGILIYIVMMFVWAFSKDTPKSKKNWARANLIITILCIILLVFWFSSAMMEIMNSGLNMEEYMGQFY